jgi:hypothetical protein
MKRFVLDCAARTDRRSKRNRTPHDGAEALRTIATPVGKKTCQSAEQLRQQPAPIQKSRRSFPWLIARALEPQAGNVVLWRWLTIRNGETLSEFLHGLPGPAGSPSRRNRRSFSHSVKKMCHSVGWRGAKGILTRWYGRRVWLAKLVFKKRRAAFP